MQSGVQSAGSTSASAQPDTNAENTEVHVVETPSADVHMPAPVGLGDVTFDIDAKESSSAYMPMDKELVLNVTDGAGAQWTLTLPPYAATAGTKITMTALQGIKSATHPGKVSGGVLLEPDGLVFEKPGSLSVSLPVGTSPTLLLTGDHHGKGLNFMQSKQENGVVSAPIEHFSSAYFEAVSDIDMQKLRDQTEQDYAAVLQQVKEFLNQPIEVSAPTSITLECFNDQKYVLARQYASLAMQPELQYFDALTGLAARMQMIGNNDTAQEALRYTEAVAKRLVLKADRILQESKQAPDRFLAAAITALSCYRKAMLAGVPAPSPEEAIGPYAKLTADYCLKEIHNNHNYKYIQGALEIGRISALLGNESIFEQILATLTFKAEYDLSFETTIPDRPDIPPDHEGSYGEAELTPEFKNGNLVLSGKGHVTYKPFEGIFISQCTFTVKGSTDFQVNVTKFDPCETDTTVLEFDRFWPDETTQFDGKNSTGYYLDAWIEPMCPPQNGKYVFTCPIKNTDPIAGENTVDKDYTDAVPGALDNLYEHLILKVKLTHTPK